MYDRNQEYKGEVTKMQREAIKLDRKSEVLQVEIDELLNLLEPDNKQKKYGTIKISNPAILKRIRDEKKERERQILKQRAAKAVDAIGDSGDIELERANDENFLTRWLEAIGRFLEYFKPFPGLVAEIQVNYDRGIGIFFQILQLTYVHSLVNGAIFGYLVFD